MSVSNGSKYAWERSRVGCFYVQKMRKRKNPSSSAQRKIKGLIKCLLGVQQLVGAPHSTPALTALAQVRGSLLFASSIHLQTLNWAATSNTCINHPCSRGLQGSERGPRGISCKGPQGRAGLGAAEVRAHSLGTLGCGRAGRGHSGRRSGTRGLTRLTG